MPRMPRGSHWLCGINPDIPASYSQRVYLSLRLYQNRGETDYNRQPRASQVHFSLPERAQKISSSQGCVWGGGSILARFREGFTSLSIQKSPSHRNWALGLGLAKEAEE